MKKLSILSFLILSVILLSCGNNSETKKTSGAKQIQTKEEKPVEKTLMVTALIGGKEFKFEGGAVHYLGDQGKLSNLYEITAGKIEENKYGMPFRPFDLAFSVSDKQTATEARLKINGYKIDKISVDLEKLETQKAKYGSMIKVVSIKGNFSGQLQKTDDSGNPAGDKISFSGTFVR